MKLKNMKVPVITTVHTTLKTQSHNGKRWLWKDNSSSERFTNLFYPGIKLLEKFYLARTRNLIFVSDWIKSFVNTKNKKSIVIQNGIDTERFAKGRPGFFDFKDKTVVLFSGRLLSVKGLRVLLEAAKEVLKEKNVLFVIAGAGNISYWKEKTQYNNNIIFLGELPYSMMPHLYYHADIFVLPSFSESFPLSLLEAMASGVAPIASDVGGIPEIISHNKNGLLFQAGDKEALAGFILKVAKYKKLRNRLGENARNTALERLSADLMAKKTIQFYKEVAG